jgi:hypothetical protein
MSLSDEPSLWDHRYICFQIRNIIINHDTFRDPKRTNWESYKDNLKSWDHSAKHAHIRDTYRSPDLLQQAILSCYQNCPAKTTCSPRNIPWWNNKLSGLKASTRKLFNTAKRTVQWDAHKETLICYNQEIRKAKWSSWRRYCKEISDVPGSARLMKITAKQMTNRVSIIKLPDVTDHYFPASFSNIIGLNINFCI